MLTPFKEITRSFSIESFAHPAEQTLTSDFVAIGEFHNFVEIQFLKSGKAELVIQEKVFNIESGSLLFIKPLRYHKISGIEVAPLKLYNLSMKIRGDLPNGIYDNVFKLDNRSKELFLSAFQKASDFLLGKADAVAGELAAYELQSLIIDVCRNPRVLQHNVLETPSALTYKAIIETMEREVLSNITLDDIAKNLNISRSYLKTLFAKYCDLSPKEYYRKLRLREAMQLLKDGYSVSKIAEMMNFSYPNHFTEFFKNETGMSPTEYRARQGK